MWSFGLGLRAPVALFLCFLLISIKRSCEPFRIVIQRISSIQFTSSPLLLFIISGGREIAACSVMFDGMFLISLKLKRTISYLESDHGKWWQVANLIGSCAFPDITCLWISSYKRMGLSLLLLWGFSLLACFASMLCLGARPYDLCILLLSFNNNCLPEKTPYANINFENVKPDVYLFLHMHLKRRPGKILNIKWSYKFKL